MPDKTKRQKSRLPVKICVLFIPSRKRTEPGDFVSAKVRKRNYRYRQPDRRAKKGKWLKSIGLNGDTVYTYYLEGITSATDLRFTFIKSPTITYDPNGGKEYVVERQYNTEEAENVYSFKPAADVPDTEAGQYFKIYDGNPQLTKSVIAGSDVTTGVTWTDNGETIDYANDHKGLTMVAQWRWRQAFIPQLGSGDTYTDSADGGTVEITSVTNTSDTNYNAAYNVNGGKSYHAETDETVTAKATAKDDFIFEGWYDGICGLV